MKIFIQFSQKFVPTGPIDNTSALVQTVLVPNRQQAII